jgi:hypothetical protein
MEQTPLGQSVTAARSRDTLQKTLLACGIAASLLYAGTDALAASLYQGYSYTSQMVSELFAVGAPTRPLVITLFWLYGLLTIAFGFGVLRSAGARRGLRVAAVLLIAYGVVGLAGPFAPMHQRGAPTSLTDTMHIVVTAAISLLMMLAIAFGSGAAGKAFRIYSIATIVLLLAGGGLAGMQGPKIPKGLPTPGFGIMERVDIYATLLWAAVLAVVRLRSLGRPGSKDGGQS